MENAHNLRKQRRIRIVNVDTNFIVEVLNWSKGMPEFASLPVFKDLPEDAEVVQLNYSQMKDCLELLVVSNEFTPVPDGVYIPSLTESYTTIKFSKTRYQRPKHVTHD